MATQGPRYPTAAVNESVTPENTDAWVNPTNVGADDTSEAVITAASFDSPDISQRLNTSGYGFTIPTGSTIDGITVEIMRRNSAGAASDNRVQLRDANAALAGDNKADTALDWPTTEALKTYGGVADTWNVSPTVAMVNDTDFGLTLSVQADAANTDIQVDFIRITITYTPPAEILLAGAATATATGSAALQVAKLLAASATAAATGSAALQVAKLLAAAATATASGTCSLTVGGEILLAAAATAGVGASVSVVLPKLLGASVTVVVTGAAALQVAKLLGAAASAESEGSCDLFVDATPPPLPPPPPLGGLGWMLGHSYRM